MTATPAVLGRPTRESNAQLELIALRGAIARYVMRTTRSRFVRDTLASSHEVGKEATVNEKAELLRLLKAKASPSDL